MYTLPTDPAPTAAELARYAAQLSAAVRLCRGCRAQLDALYTRDRAARRAAPDKYASYTTPADTAALEQVYNAAQRRAVTAAAVLFGCCALSAADYAAVIAGKY